MPFKYNAHEVPELLRRSVLISPSHSEKLATILAELMGRLVENRDKHLVVVINPKDYFHFISSPGVRELQERGLAVETCFVPISVPASDFAELLGRSERLSILYNFHGAMPRDRILVLGLGDTPLIFNWTFGGLVFKTALQDGKHKLEVLGLDKE